MKHLDLQDRASRCCPICAGKDIKRVFVDERIDLARVDSLTYASRKEPEFMSLRMIECAGCGLIYAPSIPSHESLVTAYRKAGFNSHDEADWAAATYHRILSPWLSGLDKTPNAVEIGTGTGAFLVLLRQSGFVKLIGFEPSVAAAAAAEEHIKQMIRVTPFDGNALEANSASFIGCFMTLEHVDKPKEIAEAAYSALAPGGVFAAVVHDRSAILNRILGRRSPIIDVEHLQLFSPLDLRMLMALAGFEQIQIIHFANTYRTRYWARLLPLPATIKCPITWLLDVTGLGSVPIKLRVGNMLAVGIKRSIK